jgi:cell division protein FtsW (lipid II flippase)
MTLAIGIALVSPETWLRLAWPIYGIVLLGLIGVELLGQVSGGSQRWLDIGIIRLQPSEFMKLAIVLVLARYYQSLPRGFETRLNALLPALALIAMPAALVMLQPDLGTALSITFGGVVVMFLAGVRLWLFIGAGVAAVGAAPPTEVVVATAIPASHWRCLRRCRYHRPQGGRGVARSCRAGPGGCRRGRVAVEGWRSDVLVGLPVPWQPPA